MNNQEWIKPALFGAAAGAVALAIVGFSWGGWMTAGKARIMASDQANVEVVAALLPFCLQQSKADPNMTETLARLKAAATYKRRDMVMETGWATMPGTDAPNRRVATACLEKLAAQF